MQIVSFFLFFPLGKEIIAVCGSSKQGNKDIKVGHNHKKHMQIFHINNSQLSPGATAPCVRLRQGAICLALVKGAKSPKFRCSVLVLHLLCGLNSDK